MIVLTLGDWQTCIFLEMGKMFAMSYMVGSVTLLRALGRNVGGLGVVSVRQS